MVNAVNISRPTNTLLIYHIEFTLTGLTMAMLIFFIYLKLELLTQCPASNNEKKIK